ncbi:CGNR zinc finger domain-containing protein [Microbispora triticiradicis]|uniref:CGNR zinc finger domain-containing protein n=1 Tax=Microbispora TaxID=2005 RepID=UPI0021CCE969|nr:MULTISPECIES: CGNR zinc finger domain-containing protein [Microbispora]
MTEAHNGDPRIVGGHLALDLVNTVAPRVPGGSEHHEYLPGPAALLAWAERAGVADAEEARAVAAAWSAVPSSAAQAWHAALEIRESVYTVLAAGLPAAGAQGVGAQGVGVPAAGIPAAGIPAASSPEAAPGSRPSAESEVVAALERLGLRWAGAAARSALVPDTALAVPDTALPVPDTALPVPEGAPLVPGSAQLVPASASPVPESSPPVPGSAPLVPGSAPPAPETAPGRVVRLLVGTSPALLVPDRLAHAAVEFLSTADLRRLRVCPLAEGGCGWLFLDHSRNGSRRWCAMADCGSQAKARRLTERRRARRATGVSG